MMVRTNRLATHPPRSEVDVCVRIGKREECHYARPHFRMCFNVVFNPGHVRQVPLVGPYRHIRSFKQLVKRTNAIEMAVREHDPIAARPLAHILLSGPDDIVSCTFHGCINQLPRLIVTDQVHIGKQEA